MWRGAELETGSPPRHRVLVADVEPHALRTLLVGAGYEVATATRADEAIDLFGAFAPHLVLADVELTDSDTPLVSVLSQGETPVALILLARRELIPAAIRGVAAGADGYLAKPVHGDTLQLVARRFIDDHRLRTWFDSMERRGRAHAALRRLIGQSPQIQAVRNALTQAAESRAPVLISGESGTGKRLAAELLHECRARASRFVSLSCADLSASALADALERADRDTLFLGEVSDLPPRAQELLADFLSWRPAGGPARARRAVFIAAATRRDLAAELAAGRFSAELFQLLQIEVAMPALRDARRDIPLLADHFLRQAASGRPPAAAGSAAPSMDWRIMASLVGRDWPGNTAELKRYMEGWALHPGRPGAA